MLPENFGPDLLGGVILTIVYGVLGITLAVAGFKIFDWLSPKIDIQRELGEKGNIAVAVVSGAVIVGVSIIVAAVIN
jgi:putative membrane protein